jgi:hypothetical protein
VPTKFKDVVHNSLTVVFVELRQNNVMKIEQSPMGPKIEPFRPEKIF